MYKDLRGFLARIREENDLVAIQEELDPRFEVPALLKKAGFNSCPAFMVEKTKGYPGVQTAGNLLGSWKRLALALGTGEREVRAAFLERMEKLIPPKIVSDGPVKEVIIDKNPNVLEIIPVATHYQKDAGPYFTCAVTIARDPESGLRSMGLHRIQVKDKNRLGVFLATPPLSEFYRKAGKKGEPLDVAIAAGVDPLTLLSSVIWAPTGPDKFEIAGALKMEPIELVKGTTVDIEVPAQAEFVLEGKLLPNYLEEEGPFGESSGYYLTYDNPVIEVTAITHRKDPVYHALMPWTLDEEIIIEVAFGFKALQEVKRMIPVVKNLHFLSGTCAGHAVITVEKRSVAEVRQAMLLTMLMNPQIKYVVAVDEDVDIYDPHEVEWAIATRFQADQDLIVLPQVEGSSIDPSAKLSGCYATTKIGLDATKPLDELEKFEKISVSPEAGEKINRLWGKYFS